MPRIMKEPKIYNIPFKSHERPFRFNVNYNRIVTGLIGYVFVNKMNNKLLMNVYNPRTRAFHHQIEVNESYFSSGTDSTSISYYVFDIFDYAPDNNENIVSFCSRIISYIPKAFYCFITEEILTYTSMLEGSKIKVDNEEVLLINVNNDELNIAELRKTCIGYVILQERTVTYDQIFFYSSISDKVFGNRHFNETIIGRFKSAGINLRLNQTLKDIMHNIIAYGRSYRIADNLEHESINCLNELALIMVEDSSAIEKRIIPQSFFTFVVLKTETFTNKDDILLKINAKTNLPKSETIIVPKKFDYFSLGYFRDDNETFTSLFVLPAITQCHRLELTLSVNENNMPDLDQRKWRSSKIETLPLNLKAKDYPVIGFYDNCSVLCIYNDSKERYNFVKEWNGSYGKCLALLMSDKDPVMIEYNKTSVGVIYDLIEIMTKEPQKYTYTCSRNIELISDDTEDWLIKVKCQDGIYRTYLPSILMSFILEEHLKVIKEVTGVTPTKLGFTIFTEYDNDAIERIKAHLKEACTWLDNIECQFV